MVINLLYLLLLFAGFPVGILLARLCKDEIKSWKKRLLIISIISIFLAIAVSFIPVSIYPYKFPAIISLFFITIVCLTIIWRIR